MIISSQRREGGRKPLLFFTIAEQGSQFMQLGADLHTRADQVIA